MEYIEDFKQLLKMIGDIAGENSEGYISLKEAIELAESKK